MDQDEIKNRISQYEKDIENKRIKKSSLKTEVGDGGNITRIIKEHTGKLYSMAEQYTSIAQIANERINYNQRFVFSICADGLKKYVYFNTRKQIGQKRKGFCACFF